MAGRSRSKNGVASVRLFPAIHVFRFAFGKNVDARHKAGHDEMVEWSEIRTERGLGLFWF